VKASTTERECPVFEDTQHSTSIGKGYRVFKDTENEGIPNEIERVCVIIIIDIFRTLRIYCESKIIDKLLSKSSELRKCRFPFCKVSPLLDVILKPVYRF
jgi:predicted transcriptional regulator